MEAPAKTPTPRGTRGAIKQRDPVSSFMRPPFVFHNEKGPEKTQTPHLLSLPLPLLSAVYRSTSPNTRSLQQQNEKHEQKKTMRKGEWKEANMVPMIATTGEGGMSEKGRVKASKNASKRRTIGQEGVAGHKVRPGQVCEPRSTDLASVWAVGAVADEVDTVRRVGVGGGGSGKSTLERKGKNAYPISPLGASIAE